METWICDGEKTRRQRSKKGQMDEKQAKQILGITENDNARTAKIKFRRLIGKYHPDAAGTTSFGFQEQAQRINAAYTQIMSQDSAGKSERYGDFRVGNGIIKLVVKLPNRQFSGMFYPNFCRRCIFRMQKVLTAVEALINRILCLIWENQM